MTVPKSAKDLLERIDNPENEEPVSADELAVARADVTEALQKSPGDEALVAAQTRLAQV